MSLVFLADTYNREQVEKLPLGRQIHSHELQCSSVPNVANSTSKTSFQMHLSVPSSTSVDYEGDVYAPMSVIIEFK
jgi:hypothetical protein